MQLKHTWMSTCVVQTPRKERCALYSVSFCCDFAFDYLSLENQPNCQSQWVNGMLFEDLKLSKHNWQFQIRTSVIWAKGSRFNTSPTRYVVVTHLPNYKDIFLSLHMQMMGYPDLTEFFWSLFEKVYWLYHLKYYVAYSVHLLFSIFSSCAKGQAFQSQSRILLGQPRWR